ncbi:MAG: alpha-2-macroglobulin, partial [Ferruginibacter sp.]|nr:alpha-2-macroglobulin [Chitinophagaceae bacterium]
AQTKNDYTTNWKKVDDLEKKGLTKSALDEVLSIYKLAIKDNNDAQQIKSSMYQIRFRNMVEEDSREKNIFFVDTLIARAKSPAKNILQSMQAEMFWQYLQNNRYKFYNRTKLAEENSKDISTWSLDKLHTTISGLYTASLTNNKILKETKLDGFDPVIIKGQNTRQLRPTLFDFLAHRALAYFTNDEQDLTKPGYSFTISDPKVFAPVAEFVQAVITTKDTASLHFKAIRLLQDILRVHLNDPVANALLDADLIRLNFMHQYSVHEQKNKLYEAALKSIEEKYAGNPGVAQSMYLRAMIYYNKGQDYQPNTKTENQYEIKRAKEVLDEVTRKFPKSEGGINSYNLLSQLLQPSLNLETEKVNIPNQPFRTLVKYKNAKTVYFRVIKTSREEIKKMGRRNYEKLWNETVALKSIKSWNVSMPDQLDYQAHAAEIKVDALPNGIYFILASLDANFSLQKNILAKQLIYVSNISYIHNSGNEYNVLHRDNGQPLPNTRVQVWETKYDYNTNQNEGIKAESYTTDQNGYFKLKETKEYRNFILQLTGKHDELFMDENNYSIYYNSYEQEQKPVTFLFTDRSIYRPGQVVYFKGIVLKKAHAAAGTSIIQGFKSIVQLKDVNGQKVSELTMQANDYGSYHGSFKLPEGVLNGQFSLFDETTGSTQYFSVEEYKRPKFFVDISKPNGTYRLFDSITVTGTAKAYAGNTVDGAVVKYRVVRKVRFPIWWGWGYGRKIMPPGRSTDEMEITNGEAITDAVGAFIITFKALPDESIPKTDQPTFYYEVSADITDINGETRSGETSIAVAYQAIRLNIDIPEKLDRDSLKNLKIRSVNINEIFDKALVQVTIHKAISPGKIFRGRYWEIPDQFVMGKDEYYSHFPYDVYKDEDQPNKWPLGEKLLDRTDSTQPNGDWATGNNSLNAGWYKLVAITRDKYGEEVRAEKFILIESDDKGGNSNKAGGVEAPVSVILQPKTAGPGQKINYTIKTGFEKIWLIHTLGKMDKTNSTTYHAIKQSQPFNNEISIQENDRGGIAMSYAFVQHNRVYKGEDDISVPWNNKELAISYQTFRDKILPGSEEKWTAKISGIQGEKIAAEILVSMYDASLDQFKPHGWSAINIWPGVTNKVIWMENGFSAVPSDEYNKRVYDYLNADPKSYDRLLTIFSDYSEHDRILAVGYGTRKKSMEKNMEDGSRAVPVQAETMRMQNAKELNETKFTPPKIVKDEKEIADTAVTGTRKERTVNNAIQVRKNFKETAFFFPELTTDPDGNVSFSFTIPEALTQWKLMTLAHTKELSSGYSEKTVVTQKPLMVQPNAPRFLREGDKIEFTAKIVNLSDKLLSGNVQLELLDAASGKPVNNSFKNITPTQSFSTKAGQSAAVKFQIEVPVNFNSALTYRIVATSANTATPGGAEFSDGEEMAVPVLTNRVLVTETLPLNLRNSNTKDFKFEKLLNSSGSSSISNHALTVEYTSNPAWYAVQALPYLMEYPYDCAEQT